MYDYDYIGGSSNNIGSAAAGSVIWGIIAAVLAVVGGILVYFLFIKKDNKGLSKKLVTLKELLDFKIMIIEPILKVLYLIGTIYVILFSFSFIGQSFLLFLIVLILGPIIIRLVYEGFLIMIMIWKNTKEIATKKIILSGYFFSSGCFIIIKLSATSSSALPIFFLET